SPTSGPEGGAPPPGTGASSAVPNSSYHNHPSSPNHDAVQSSVDAALPRLELHSDPRGGSSVQRNPDGTLSITVDGRTRTAEVAVVPAASMNNPTDVANFDVSGNPI